MYGNFERKEIAFDLRTKDLCKLPMIKNRYGSESLSLRGSLLWNTDKIKQSPTLTAFKNQVKSWTFESAPAGYVYKVFLYASISK